MSILITGSAGFIGFHLSLKLLKEGHTVIGIDNLNNYYSVKLKKERLNILHNESKKLNFKFNFIQTDLENKENLNDLFIKYKPAIIINLAAQAGVRYSIENPDAYVQSNLVGFINILELARKFKIEHLIYASSSSVYGGNKRLPFKESDSVDHPVSLYAATKKANELMAHSYSHLYDIPVTGLRFFTVYGPWGRPDMALFLFTKAILEGKEINVYNNGNMIRDFTYIDDIVESIHRLMSFIPQNNTNFNFTKPNPSQSWCPHRILNIGNSNPVNLLDFITEIEDKLGIKAKKINLPMQPGDVASTSADTKLLESLIGFKPKTSIKEGISKFVDWYRDFYKV